MRDLHPQQGGRVLLERTGLRSDEITYRVALYDPTRAWEAMATIDLAEGQVALGDWSGEGEPPAWLRDAAYGFLRSLLNSRRRPDAPPWPRRLLRWRAG